MWSKADFDRVKAAGLRTLAFVSGNDDPAAVKALAASWGVTVCLDVESGIRGDGPWVQGWLDASGAGLYGNYSVLPSRRAAFYVLADYPGGDPHATWPSYHPKPSGPVAWQCVGTHREFGCSVDRAYYEDAIFGARPQMSQGDVLDSTLIFRALVDELIYVAFGRNATAQELDWAVAHAKAVGAGEAEWFVEEDLSGSNVIGTAVHNAFTRLHQLATTPADNAADRIASLEKAIAALTEQVKNLRIEVEGPQTEGGPK